MYDNEYNMFDYDFNFDNHHYDVLYFTDAIPLLLCVLIVRIAFNTYNDSNFQCDTSE